MRDMLEQLRKLVESLFQNAEMKSKDPMSSNAKDKFKVTDPKHYCRGARQLEAFLARFCLNFRTHNHLFPGGDTDHVQCTLNYLPSWANYADHALETMTMTDPVTWGYNLLANDHPCLHVVHLFITEIQKQYGDKDRRQNSSLELSQEMMAGYHNPDKTVCAYANRL
jgi:hypothetical protein